MDTSSTLVLREEEEFMTKSRKMRRAFAPEFKREAVRLWETKRAAGVSINRVARELGIRPGQLREWAGQQTAAVSAPASSGESPNEELRRLRRENARLKQEVEFAKKAAAFFAKESQ
jgi:transposase